MPAYQGRDIFSAARQGTEEPPCVLASLAMSVLQKNCICGLAFVQALTAGMIFLHTDKHQTKRNTRIRALVHKEKTSEKAINFRCLLYSLVEESGY
jgi:hypothetical protein